MVQLIGEMVAIYWADTGTYIGEMLLDRGGLLIARADAPDLQESVNDIIEHVLESLGLPHLGDNKGYAYQPGCPGFLQEAAELVDSCEVWGRPLWGCVRQVPWCPVFPSARQSSGQNQR